MLPFFHHQEDFPEFQEILPFLGFQGMRHEKRNNPLKKVLRASYAISHSVSMIGANDAAAEMRLEGLQDLHISPVLNHREFRQNLNSGGHFGMNIQSYVETAFSINETDDPLGL